MLWNHIKMRVTHDAHHQRDIFFQALFKLHLNSVGSAVKISEGKKKETSINTTINNPAFIMVSGPVVKNVNKKSKIKYLERTQQQFHKKTIKKIQKNLFGRKSLGFCLFLFLYPSLKLNEIERSEFFTSVISRVVNLVQPKSVNN